MHTKHNFAQTKLSVNISLSTPQPGSDTVMCVFVNLCIHTRTQAHKATCRTKPSGKCIKQSLSIHVAAEVRQQTKCLGCAPSTQRHIWQVDQILYVCLNHSMGLSLLQQPVTEKRIEACTYPQSNRTTINCSPLSWGGDKSHVLHAG